MNKRGLIIVSTLFGLFALSFGVLGIRALTLGPDPAQPSAAQVAERVTAANTLERKIAAAKAEAPPALPAVPDRTAPAPAQAAAENAARAAYVDDDEYEGGREYEDDDEHEDHGDEDEHEEGDDDDD